MTKGEDLQRLMDGEVVDFPVRKMQEREECLVAMEAREWWIVPVE